MCVTFAPGCLTSFTASRLNSSVNVLLILGMSAFNHITSFDVSRKLVETQKNTTADGNDRRDRCLAEANQFNNPAISA